MNVVDWAVDTMDALGGLGVALLIFLENVFPPIPSEVILPLAGVAAAKEGHSFLEMLLFSLAGSVAGAWVLYGLGRALGPARLRSLFLRLPLLHVEDFDRTVDWMRRHGTKGVFFGRMVPGIRSLVSIPAGLFAMPFWRFTLLTLAGSAIWNALFITLGFTLGVNWHVIEPFTEVISNIVYAVIALLLVIWVVRLVRRERRRRAQGLPDPDLRVRAQEHDDDGMDRDDRTTSHD
ncbi:DedA family protein [Brachybacterium sp. NPDC056505]|uniref:DedA family protein n=1 Tax=Brachybacterium sp. NPDC056505 TaxID=3345843 RepID=UPI0036721B70